VILVAGRAESFEELLSVALVCSHTVFFCRCLWLWVNNFVTFINSKSYLTCFCKFELIKSYGTKSEWKCMVFTFFWSVLINTAEVKIFMLDKFRTFFFR